MDPFWKDKTVAVYIALQHHTRYIIPVMERLAEMGADIIYLVGQAERSQEITAIEKQLRYFHVFDFLSAEDHREIEKNYRSIKNRFAKTMRTDIAFSAVVPTVMDKTLYASAQEFTAFQNFFSRFKPDLCFALHERNRWGKIFSFHSKKTNTPFITLQEGLFTTSDLLFIAAGHIRNSTIGLLWGKGTKDYLCDYDAPRDRAIPAGNTLLADKIITLKQNNARENMRKKYGIERQTVVLLLFSAILHPVEEFMPIFEYFGQTGHRRLFVKFHPVTTKEVSDKWLRIIPEQVKERIRFIHGEEDIYELVAMSDVCVLSDTSTTGLEALAIGRPIVFLKLKAPKVIKSSLPKRGIAPEYSPLELASLLETDDDLPIQLDQKKIAAYLSEELTAPEKSIETTIKVMKKVIAANHARTLTPLAGKKTAARKFTMVIPVIDQPDQLLSILESTAVHSADYDYEVILVRPANVSTETQTILNSLKGDVSFLEHGDPISFIEMLNHAGANAEGKTLLFFGPCISPGAGWLDAVTEALEQYGTDKVYGGKVTDVGGSIIHAGMLVDKNNSPVSAFKHMDQGFSPANQPGSFEIIDRFMAVKKDLFLKAGGFSEESGRYLFMDFCLKLGHLLHHENAILYLPNLRLMQLAAKAPHQGFDDSIYFYSKWHGVLWDNEEEFYRKQGLSRTQMDTARMAQAIKSG